MKVKVLLREVQQTKLMIKNSMPVHIEEDSDSDSDVSEYLD